MLFPIGDDQIVGGYKPYFSYGLIVINTLIFIYEVSLNQQGQNTFAYTYGTIPDHITHGSDYYTLLTNMFLHGGWMHLIGNMVFLWVFADNIEATIGSIPFILFYLFGGVFASLAHVFSDMDSQIVSLGASGAIAAVLGAYLVMFPKSKVKMIFLLFMNTFKIPAYIFLGIWFVQQIFSGVGQWGDTSETGGVAWWAHIGGFVFGIIGGYFAKQSYMNKSPIEAPTKPIYRDNDYV